MRKPIDLNVASLLPYCSEERANAFVLAGGAALYCYGLREELTDLDVYCRDKSVFARWARLPHEEVDLTANENFWGQLNIGDASNAPVFLETARMTVHLLSLETLFIMKADAGRERDIEDLEHIRDYVDPMDILERMRELQAFNTYGTWYMCAENLLAEIQLQYGLPVTQEMIEAIGAHEEDKQALCDAFGVATHKRKIGVAS